MIVVILIIFLSILFYLYKSNIEKLWNYGYCPKCGTKWILFDEDPLTGKKGFRCPKCGEIIWIDIDLKK